MITFFSEECQNQWSNIKKAGSRGDLGLEEGAEREKGIHSKWKITSAPLQASPTLKHAFNHLNVPDSLDTSL